MLNFVTATGQKFADSTEQVVSDASSYGPVGTTMALLEASSKFFSAIHKRLHKSQKDEFKILAKINYDYLPNEYPFDVPGMSQKILKRDFDGRVDVIPVSDPNIPSNAHRMMLAQMALQLAQQSPPGMFNLEALNRTILDAANMPNLDEILPPKKEPKPLDPLSDIAAATRGLPIAAFPGQNHDAHVQVKMAFLQDPMNGQNPAMQRVVPVLQSNIQEHMIMKYQEQINGIAQQLVGNLPPEQQQMPNIMEVAMAQAASQVQNANMAMGKQQSPESQMVELEKARLQIEQQKLQLDTMKNASDASLKNRELDIEETEVALKAIQDGQQQLIKSEEKEKDRINKQAMKAVDTLVGAATEEAKLQNAQQLKAMDLLAKLSQISEQREVTENTEGLKALMKVIETAILAQEKEGRLNLDALAKIAELTGE
jgi:hypothetical protein